jgi:hypothetical protein
MDTLHHSSQTWVTCFDSIQSCVYCLNFLILFTTALFISLQICLLKHDSVSGNMGIKGNVKKKW